MGMTYELYWFGDTWMVSAYREADKLRQERRNEDAWLNGLYQGMAISSTIGNAFLPKGSTPVKYPERPIASKKEEMQEEDEDNTAFARLYMASMVRAGKNWGKGRE